MPTTRKIAVIGGGSWATALVKVLSSSLDEVLWWMRNAENIEHIQKYHHNPSYLSMAELDAGKLRMSTDFKNTIAQAETLDFLVALESHQGVGGECVNTRALAKASTTGSGIVRRNGPKSAKNARHRRTPHSCWHSCCSRTA